MRCISSRLAMRLTPEISMRLARPSLSSARRPRARLSPPVSTTMPSALSTAAACIARDRAANSTKPSASSASVARASKTTVAREIFFIARCRVASSGPLSPRRASANVQPIDDTQPIWTALVTCLCRTGCNRGLLALRSRAAVNAGHSGCGKRRFATSACTSAAIMRTTMPSSK